jgi:2,3-bisphosphoglycerate-independent phosphoglycerate mutase
MGLLGGGVTHASSEHLYSLIHLARIRGVKDVFIHVFTDGRDSPPNSSLTYITELEGELAKEGVGKIATIMGRYYAMDRDRRWERTEKAYLCLTKGRGGKALSAVEAVKKSYEDSITDEFIEPTVIQDRDIGQKGLIKDNDAVVFFNFRIDRPRQLCYAFVKENDDAKTHEFDFDPHAVRYEHTHFPKEKPNPFFKRGRILKNLFFVTMTEYSKLLVSLGTHTAFSRESVKMTLGRVVSLNNLRQLRATESEKERFVTYYFNGQEEKANYGEDRLIVPSPKIATYDLMPEMSAFQLTSELRRKLVQTTPYAFILVNYANVDMVGHTGKVEAAVKAVEAVDNCLGELSRLIIAYGGTMIVTADHGNAEKMKNQEDGGMETEHSDSPVPFIAISKKFMGKPIMLPIGILADIAPTVLYLMGLTPPASMTGRNLLASIIKRR